MSGSRQETATAVVGKVVVTEEKVGPMPRNYEAA